MNLELDMGDSDDDDEKVDRKGFDCGISKSSVWHRGMSKQWVFESSLKESGSIDNNKKVLVLSPESL